jgi:ATP-dependent Clp protease ATP-binding subunit ClpB
MDAVRAHFRPEFLNRLDEMIIFDRLSRRDMDGIVDDPAGRLERRLAERKIVLELDEGARSWLADEGYDPVFGARPLKRVIQRALQDPLAEMLLAGEVMDGDTVHVTAGADGLIGVGDRAVPWAFFGVATGRSRTTPWCTDQKEPSWIDTHVRRL